MNDINAGQIWKLESNNPCHVLILKIEDKWVIAKEIDGKQYKFQQKIGDFLSFHRFVQ